MIRERNRGIEEEKMGEGCTVRKSFDPEAEPYPRCTPESPGGGSFNDVKLFSRILLHFSLHISRKRKFATKRQVTRDPQAQKGVNFN